MNKATSAKVKTKNPKKNMKLKDLPEKRAQKVKGGGVAPCLRTRNF
jgi:hypothetical protein